MAKAYEDLSRRALIKLGRDFDLDNDAILLEYLSQNADKYEDAHVVEKLIQKVYDVKDTFSDSGSIIKKTIIKESDKLLDTVIDTLSEAVERTEELLN